MQYKKNKLCLALLVATATPMAIQAQETAYTLEEIVVTAEKREASLQDTAIAVTALDGSLLEQKNIEDSLDLQFSVPNMMVGSNSNITLRGVGQSVLGGGADPAVSSSFNSMPIAPSGEVYDLERIEVLRGPQGTLFGRNTTGGVINTISAKPSDTRSVDISVQAANFDSLRTKGAINLPITDSISQRFAFYSVNRDGYTKNVFNGDRIDGRDEFSIRSSTYFEFGDSANATLVLQYYKEDSDRQSSVKIACKPDAAIGCAPDTGDTIGYPADFSTSVDATLLSFGVLKPNRYGANPNPSDLRTVSIDVNPQFEFEEAYAGLEVNIDLSDTVTLTSATAYVNNHYNQFRDFDLAAAPDAFNVTAFTPTGELTYLIDDEFVTTSDYSPTQRNKSYIDSFSQEFRLASSFDGDLNFLAGISYSETNDFFDGTSFIPGLHNTLGAVVFGAPLPTNGFTNISDLNSKSAAVFGELYYDLSEDLVLTAGLRYTKDKKILKGGANPVGDVTTIVEGRGEWSEVTGKLNLSWDLDLDFTDSTMVYGTLSRGYKGGGINLASSVSPTFEPEYIDAIEVGSKNTLLDNRVQLNTALFYYDYSDYQAGGLINGSAANFNAEKVKIKGLELEGAYLLSENFLINFNASFLDTEIISSDPLPNSSLGNAPGTSTPLLEDVNGNELPNAPSQSFSIGLQYTQKLAQDYQLRYRLDYYWQDEFQAREFDNYTYEAWGRADAYLTLSENQGTWEVEAFVKNLSNDDGITGGSAEASVVGLFRKLRLLDPRTFGLEFTYHWD